ncbi:MAG: SpoIIE family protein phosphatase [Rhodoferax sp.]|nr:SpoIIE family protein phosphatase [Rhodoferax sp.]
MTQQPAAPSDSLYVHSEADVAAAMRLGRDWAQRAGFSGVETAYLATVATELASNLWIHAGGGVFSVLLRSDLPGIEIATCDQGPGIADIALALQDGYSTAGGLGCGLPSINRLMDGLEINGRIGGGTQVRAWKVKHPDAQTVESLALAHTLPAHIGYSLRPIPGESHCGDQCGVWQDESGQVLLALADGLGHGPQAAKAAKAALHAIGELRAHPCEDIFAYCDDKLRDTRGVALALALIEPALGRLRFASVGNVRAVLLHGDRDLRLGSARGIVGAGYSELAPETLAFGAGDSLFLYSDGLDELLPLRDLLRPAVTAHAVAETALQRWAKANDDASMLVYLGQPV